MRELAVYENAVIVIRDGRFAFVGRESEIDADLHSSINADFDAQGAERGSDRRAGAARQ